VHLADQLIVPLALAGDGGFRTLPLTRHAETNLDVVQRFLPVRARFERESASGGVLEIARAS
jgi:RNA 3'-terminal phosphate cyclase (ATP)